MKMRLTEPVIKSFRVAKMFRENTDKLCTLNYSPSGELVISCSADDQIVMYDCEKGLQIRTVNSKKYGVDHILFTHGNNTAVHSSTKIDDTIRYLSLHDNKYLRYFPGHTKKVVSLSISPIEDGFLSGSLDKTLRLWDLRSPNCQGVINVHGRPVASYDPEGLIIAAGINSECLKLYDLRSFDKGPFISFDLSSNWKGDWTDLKFSRDGKYILLNTNGTYMQLVDAFHGTPLHTFTGYCNSDFPVEGNFSPDSQYVISGSNDGRVHVWNVDTGHKVTTLVSEYCAPIKCVGFNPKFMMIATAYTNMMFWVPVAEEAEVKEF